MPRGLPHSSGGFTFIELALALAVLGMLLLPLTHTLSQLQTRKRAEATMQALQNAKEALLNYAVHHQGCLPHAADSEGGLRDTDSAGISGVPDTGSVRQSIEPAEGNEGQRAGDIPWADLNLSGMGIDGDQLRLQYYVASPFTAPLQSRASNDQPVARIGCTARTRDGIEVWQPATPYKAGDIVAKASNWYVATDDSIADNAPPGAPWQLFGTVALWNAETPYHTRQYVSYAGSIYRALSDNTAASPNLSPAQWIEVGVPNGKRPPAWQEHMTESYHIGEVVTDNGRIYRATAPLASATLSPAQSASWEEISLPTRFLETRVGPTINTPPGNIVATRQNVAILIAPGRDENKLLNRSYMRDANHMNCSNETLCSNWSSINDSNVDSRSFSITADTADSLDSPDQILPISYTDYQNALVKAGLSPQPVRY